MKIRSLAILLVLGLMGFQTPKVQAQNAADVLQSIGSSHWRIGSPLASTGIYIEAPSNLTAKEIPVVQGTKPPKIHTEFIAQNDSVLVVLQRGLTSEYEDLKKEYFGRIGANAAAAQPVNIASYSGLRLESAGKIAFVIKYGKDVWAVAISPQTAPDAKEAALKSANSLWFERREDPEWKDRAVGTTSFQADLPFEMAPRPYGDADTVNKSLRWNNFWVDATEWRAGNTDLEGTVKLQIENFKKQGGLENIRVKELDRAYKWGFLENGERGKWVQIDYTEGGQPRRIYKLFSMAGTRVVVFQITLNSNDPRHLLAAHRILGSARLGWTDAEDFVPQKVTQERFELDSDSPYLQIGEGAVHIYQGFNPLSLIFVLPRPKPVNPDPAEMDLDAQAVLQVGLQKFLDAAGGKVVQSRVEALGGSVFPTRRILFEAKVGNRIYNGDGAVISQARSIVFPFRLTETASFDLARRWATSFHGDAKIPFDWPTRTMGTVDIIAPNNATLSADKSELMAEDAGVKIHVKTVAKPYEGAPNFNPGPNETSPVTDSEIEAAMGLGSWQMQNAVTEAAKAAGITKTDVALQPVCAGNALGMGGWFAWGDTKYPRLDVIALHDGANLWTLELGWSPADPASARTRDGVLSSLRGK